LPALVGVISVGVYVVVALVLVGPLGYRGLVWADTAKQAGHALLMALLVSQMVGTRRAWLGSGILWILVAGIVLVGVAWGVTTLLHAWLWSDVAVPYFVRDGVDVVVASGIGVGAYVWVLHWARIPELATLVAQVSQRLGRGAH
jgi:putative peptidoglycan lipid II flippase